jgi:hypothetical protein
MDELILLLPGHTFSIELSGKSDFELLDKTARLLRKREYYNYCNKTPDISYLIYQIRESKMNHPDFKENAYLGPGTIMLEKYA